MRLVVDANILFSFFKKASFTRRFILTHPEIVLTKLSGSSPV